MKSDFEIHSVVCDLPSRRFDFAALRRVFIKDRIRIVDVNIDAALPDSLLHVVEAPSGTADWQMTHRERRLGSCSLRDKLIVGPAGPVEQDAVAAPENLLEARIDLLDAGDVG